MRMLSDMVVRILVAVFFSAVLFSCVTVQATDSQGAAGQKPVLYFFHSDLCPHCIEAKPFVAELKKRYPQIEIREMEVSENQVNREIFIRKMQELGIERRGVPFFLVGKQYVVGFRKGFSEEAIRALIETHLSPTPAVK